MRGLSSARIQGTLQVPKTSPPKVSVLMPSYNHEHYVEQAVDSVLGGSFSELELIVVDDGSTDSTVERLRAVEDSRMEVHVQHNQGAHVAFNRALDLARGEVVFLINSDDRFKPDRIASLVTRLLEGDSVAVASWIELIDHDGQALGVKHAWHDLPPWTAPTRQPRLSELGDPRAALLETNWVSTTSNIAFRRSAAEDLRFRPLRYCHDWDFLLGLARRGPMELVQDALVQYRVHPENTLKEGQGTGQAQMWLEIWWVLLAHGLPLLEQLPKTADSAQRFWSSLPRFAGQEPPKALFALRGSGTEPTPGFMGLLEADNPFRQDLLDFLQHVSGHGPSPEPESDSHDGTE